MKRRSFLETQQHFMPPKDSFIPKCGLVRAPYFRNALTPWPYFTPNVAH